MRPIADIFRSYAVFDEHGRHVNGTDKQSNHSYGDAYERIVGSAFSQEFDCYDRRIDPRDSVGLVMEVGVADGSSLLAWREVFPNALIVGMDIHHSDKAHGERIEFHYGDQCNREHCERAASNRRFDMIVEDATHKLGNTLLTLFWLWPFVRPGGIYVVEEWDGVHTDRDRIIAMWPGVSIIGTCGPHLQDEPLVVFRKPLV